MSQTKAQLIDNLVQPITGALGSASAPTFSFTTDPNTGIYSPGADQLAISTGGTGRLFVDSSGRVGVGTASPGKTLDVTGEIRCSSRFQTFGDVISSDWIYVGSSAGARGISSDAISRALLFGINGSEVARFDTSGRLGVGTSSPSRILHVTGTADTIPRFNAPTSSYAGIEFTENNSNTSGNYWQIYKAPSTHTLEFYNGSTRMLIDASGRVGIGTSSPGELLHISGTSNPSVQLTATNDTTPKINWATNGTDRLEITSSSVVGASINVRSNQELRFGTNNTERVRITNGGNVGIGTTSPNNALVIAGGTGGFEFNPNSVSNTNVLISYDRNASAYRNIRLEYGGNFALQDGATERLRIDSSGRLLVGTSSSATTDNNANSPNIQLEGADGDASRLLIRSNAGTTASAGPVLYLARSRGTTANSKTAVAQDDFLGSIVFEGTDGVYDRRAASITAFVDAAVSGGGASDMPGRLVFSTTGDGSASPTERGRIINSGYWKISNSGAYNYGTRAAHEIRTDNNDWNTIFVNSHVSGPYGINLYYSNASPNGTGNEFIACTDSSFSRFVARSNGGLANYQANNVNLSDINTKKDISPAVGTWDCIKEWEIVNYRYKDQPDDADLNIGVIAQQVAESCPEVITIFQEAKEATEDQPAQEERLGIKEQQMYWMAIKALQEAQVRIEALEAEVAVLKAQ